MFFYRGASLGGEVELVELAGSKTRSDAEWQKARYRMPKAKSER